MYIYVSSKRELEALHYAVEFTRGAAVTLSNSALFSVLNLCNMGLRGEPVDGGAKYHEAYDAKLKSAFFAGVGLRGKRPSVTAALKTLQAWRPNQAAVSQGVLV